MSSRIILYSPDRAITYDGRTPEAEGVGGGITARIALATALAALGHDVTAYVNCAAPLQHRGVTYVPLDQLAQIDGDVLIAITTGGDLSFAPLRRFPVRAPVRIVYVQGVPKPAELDAVGASHACVASRFLRDVVVQRWGVAADRVFVSYNGMHQERFIAAESSAPPRDPFALSYIGPPEKGLDAAIGVLRRLRRHDARYRLDVFGGGRLWGQREDGVPVEPGVRSMGLVGQAALVPQLFAYEYCLAPQAMEEGFGIALQEARRAGQIAIASRVGAFAELVDDGVDGFLIDEPHHTDAAQERMAEIVIALERDRERHDRIRRAAQKAASAFTWERAAEEIVAHVRRAHLQVCQVGVHTADLKVCPTTLRTTSRTILLAGYFGHGNLGDEAILESLVDACRRASSPIDVVVASHAPEATEREHGVRAVHERDMPALETAIRDCDAVVLSGGLFHDRFGIDEHSTLTSLHWGIASCLTFAKLASTAGRLLILHGVGVGPLESDAARRLTKEVFDIASRATVRDDASRDLLAAIGVEVEVTADPVFGVRPESSRHQSSRPRVSVILRTWIDLASADWHTPLAAALDRLIEDRTAHVQFLPFQATDEDELTDDRAAIQLVRGRMRHESATTVAPVNMPVAQVREIIANSDLVIAMRLHAAIMAASAGVPLVAIAYDDKVRSVMTSAGHADDVIDLAGVAAGRIAQMPAWGSDGGRASDGGRVFRPGVLRARDAARGDLDELTRFVNESGGGPKCGPPYVRGGPPYVRRGRLGLLFAPLRFALRRLTRRQLQDAPTYAFDLVKRARQSTYDDRFDRLRGPADSRLVSIVLPVYNGAPIVHESIDSVLAQTYDRIQLIIVDDGSTDETPEILRKYSKHHGAGSRISLHFIRQDNAGLPDALSRGCREATGEFLTWTSADNRMKPECIEKLVAALERHPSWDMAYANLDLIGEDGAPLRESEYYSGYQYPEGAEHIYLPVVPARLNTEANNHVGAAFLYRSRVRDLIGDYSRHRVLMEDYDYWMRVNTFMTLRHADFEEPVYEYRFHSQSLTSRWEELDMLGRRRRLMAFDDYRRDVALQPMVWSVDGDSPLARSLLTRIRGAGHVVHEGQFDLTAVPATGVPVVHVTVTAGPSAFIRAPRLRLPIGATTVLIADTDVLPVDVDETWDMCVAFADASSPLPRLDAGRGWMAAADADTLFSAIDVRAKSNYLSRLEEAAENPEPAELDATVVICTRGGGRLGDVLAALDAQDFDGQWEVVVVNNRMEARSSDPALPRVRVVLCPVIGLSPARNAGLAVARGEVVCFLDDDAVPARNWLSTLLSAFKANPHAGVVGGRISLELPDPHPFAARPGWRKYWSEFTPTQSRYVEVDDWDHFPWGANWAARRDVLRAIGGFRSRYGRSGSNYWGGEELVAARLVRSLGYAVGIEPRASVVHRIDPKRFTLKHVFKTMVAGFAVRHRAQQDRYLGREDSLETILRRLLREHVDPDMRADSARWIDVVFRKIAQLNLLRLEIGDLWRRILRPAVRRS